VGIENFLKILDTAHNGPFCTVDEWNKSFLPTRVSEKLKKFRLERTCDPSNPVNTDDGLADAFFHAGIELALEVGFLCQDTERIIMVSEEELGRALQNAKSHVILGNGRDAVTWETRRPEDSHPAVVGAPMGNLISEELWVVLHQEIVKCREIDTFGGGILPTIFNHRVLAGTPYETLVGRYHAQLTREVLWRAGRSGMAVRGIPSSPTAYGQLGGFGTVGGLDPSINHAGILSPSELMTNYEILHKVANAINCGSYLALGSASMIGGYLGPPEAAVLAQIACTLLQLPIHQADFVQGQVVDTRYGGDCGWHGQWAESIHGQAISRNTHLLDQHVVNQTAGPCTEMLLYESAVGLLNISASGVSLVYTPRSGGGKYADHLTPLECKFCGELVKRSAGMSRKQANEIAVALIPRYEKLLRNPPKGKSFRECYDLKTLQPTTEWINLYRKVKKELIEIGVPLESVLTHES
jgi:methylamine--corrinoid protein Co-methyltransferase